MLTAAQQAALDHVRAVARQATAASGARVDPALVDVAVRARRVALNFHPDRLGRDGRVVAKALLDDGVYRSQFETGISNGGLSAYPGGDRDRWEERLFGGAYQRHHAPPADRPKYGGLNLLDHPDGPCPRFGSCHLVLRPHVAERTTFCYGDSHRGPRHVGTADAFEPVLAAWLEEHPAEWLTASAQSSSGGDGEDDDENGRALDDYIEAQVHGPVDLGRDAEALVIDPSFDGTEVGRLLNAVADRYGLRLTRHAGFEFDAADVPADFRGPEAAELARRIEADVGGPLNAERIGRFARAVADQPDTLQLVKYVWHVLVVYRQPRR